MEDIYRVGRFIICDTTRIRVSTILSYHIFKKDDGRYELIIVTQKLNYHFLIDENVDYRYLTKECDNLIANKVYD